MVEAFEFLGQDGNGRDRGTSIASRKTDWFTLH